MGFKWGPFRATFGNWMAFYRLSHLTNNLLWLCVERRPKPYSNSHIIIAKSLGKTPIKCVRQSGSNSIRYCVASKSATYWKLISKALQLYLTNNLSVLWTWSQKFPQLSSLTLRVKPTFDSDESWMKTLFIATVKTEDVTPGSINHWSYWTAIINQSEHLERYLKKN